MDEAAVAAQRAGKQGIQLVFCLHILRKYQASRFFHVNLNHVHISFFHVHLEEILVRSAR